MMLSAPHPDYVTWEGMKHLLPTEEFIVFLDEGLDCHPDYAKLGMPPVMEARAYEQMMRMSFLRVSRDMGSPLPVPVIIAGHPRVKRNVWWADCVVLTGETCE